VGECLFSVSVCFVMLVSVWGWLVVVCVWGVVVVCLCVCLFVMGGGDFGECAGG